MKRMMFVAAALLLVMAACGDDDAETTTSGGETTTTTTGASTTSMAETTTTTAAETTTTTEALSGPEAFIAGAAEYVGEYEGQWNNTTFGSTGALYINVLEANTDAGFVLIQVDADGNVFGAADPDLFAIEIFTSGDGLEMGSTDLFGSATFEIDEDGTFTVVANPPDLGDMTLQIEGGITADSGFEGTYTIPDLAEGTWSVAPIG